MEMTTNNIWYSEVDYYALEDSFEVPSLERDSYNEYLDYRASETFDVYSWRAV